MKATMVSIHHGRQPGAYDNWCFVRIEHNGQRKRLDFPPKVEGAECGGCWTFARCRDAHVRHLIDCGFESVDHVMQDTEGNVITDVCGPIPNMG